MLSKSFEPASFSSPLIFFSTYIILEYHFFTDIFNMTQHENARNDQSEIEEWRHFRSVTFEHLIQTLLGCFAKIKTEMSDRMRSPAVRLVQYFLQY